MTSFEWKMGLNRFDMLYTQEDTPNSPATINTRAGGGSEQPPFTT